MFRGSMVMGLAAVFVVALGVTGAGPGGSAALAQTPGQGRPAARPENRNRQFISQGERIALGVEEPTWIKEHGKVHPDVRRALAYQKQVEDNLEKERDWIDIMEVEGPEAFLGYAYVVVHLECDRKVKGDSEADKPAIRQLQDSVLSKLTAVDFRYWLRFPERPAIIGFVSEAGLKKLAENTDVRAIGLDDKPYPDLYKPEFYHEGRGRANGVLPKISPQVVSALEKAGEVRVLVAVRGKDGEEERTVESFRRGRTLNDSVLACLSAQEFNVMIMDDVTPYFDGWVTKSGLAKLAEHTEVREVQLPAPPPRPAGQRRKGP